MNLSAIIEKWLWIVGIVVVCLQAGFLSVWAEDKTMKNPQLANGYRKIIRGYLIWFNLPLVVMGIGCTIGGVPGIVHYFRPQDGNPYVIAFYFTIFLILGLGTYWIFLKGGAQMLSQHNFGYPFLKEPWLIKIIWVFMVTIFILSLVKMYLRDIPVAR